MPNDSEFDTDEPYEPFEDEEFGEEDLTEYGV